MQMIARAVVESRASYFLSAQAFLAKPKAGKIVRDLRGLEPSLGFMGALEVRLAVTKREIRKAQRLRYKVFFQDGSATPDRRAHLLRRDVCRFDAICDHLIVVDHAHRNRMGRPKPKVVGAYRLLRQDVAERNFGFYSAGEFDIAPLLARHAGKQFLELGRSCVAPEYRSKRTLELLWRGLWAYACHHKIDCMIGCASFESIEPKALALPLSFLHHHALANEEWRADALAVRLAPMDLLPRSAIDARRAMQTLPPLIKGYLRAGARVGSGAVVDLQFGTTDVLIVLPVADVDRRYSGHFSAPLARAA